MVEIDIVISDMLFFLDRQNFFMTDQKTVPLLLLFGLHDLDGVKIGNGESDADYDGVRPRLELQFLIKIPKLLGIQIAIDRIGSMQIGFVIIAVNHLDVAHALETGLQAGDTGTDSPLFDPDEGAVGALFPGQFQKTGTAAAQREEDRSRSRIYLFQYLFYDLRTMRHEWRETEEEQMADDQQQAEQKSGDRCYQWDVLSL